MPAVFNQSGDVALLSVVPNSSPSRQATVDLVTEIRDRGPALKDDTGAESSDTSTTALNIDMSDELNAALIPYLGVVVGLALILLLLDFRSTLVPTPHRTTASNQNALPFEVFSERSTRSPSVRSCSPVNSPFAAWAWLPSSSIVMSVTA